MTDLNISAYATVATFMQGSATAIKNYAQTGQSVAARILAACAIERIRMPSASLEKVIDTAFSSLKIDVLTPESVKQYRHNATTALRHLASTNEFPKVESGAAEAVILAKVQTLIETYSLRGLVKAASEARAPKVAAKAAIAQAVKVAAAEATHQENVAARVAMGLAPDNTFDALTFQRLFNECIAKGDAGDDGCNAALDFIHVTLEARRMANASNVTPLLLAAA